MAQSFPVVQPLVHAIHDSLINPGGAAGPGFGGGILFPVLIDLPLLVDRYGVDSALDATLSRNSIATVPDFESLSRTVMPYEFRFRGARRVESIAAKLTGVTGTATVNEISADVFEVSGLSSLEEDRFYASFDSLMKKSIVVGFSIKALNASDVDKQFVHRIVTVGGSDSLVPVGTLTSDFVSYGTGVAVSGTGSDDVWFHGSSTNNADGFVIKLIREEDVTDQSNQSPAEFVEPNDSASSDGKIPVRCFPYTNGDAAEPSTGVMVKDIAGMRRTENLFTAPNDFGDPAWQDVNATHTADGTVTVSATYGRIEEGIQGVAGRRYTISMEARNISGSTAMRLFGLDTGAGLNEYKSVTLTSQWVIYSYTFSAATASGNYRSGIYSIASSDFPVFQVRKYQIEDATDNVNKVRGEFVDAIQYNGGIGIAYFSTTNANSADANAIVTEAVGTPLVTGSQQLTQMLGAFEEESSTNAIPYSNDVTQWLKDGSIATPDFETITGLDTATTSRLRLPVVKATSSTIFAALSIKLKANGNAGESVRIRVSRGGTTTYEYVQIEPVTLTDEWVEYSLLFKPTVDHEKVLLYIEASGIAPIATTCLVKDAQIEIKPSNQPPYSSFIPTSGTSITRQSDYVQTYWLPEFVNDFMLACDWTFKTDKEQIILATGNLVLHYISGTLTFVKGSFAATIPLSAVLGTTYHIEGVISPTQGVDIFLNGAKGTGNADVTDIAPGAMLSIGSTSIPDEHINGAIKNIKLTRIPPPPAYLLQASFDVANQALSDGQFLGTSEGVEIGRLTAFDQGAGIIEIADNKLKVQGAGGWGDPISTGFNSDVITRSMGRALFCKVTSEGASSDGLFGFSDSQVHDIGLVNLICSIRFASDSTIRIIYGDGNAIKAVTFDTITAGVEHESCLILGGYDVNGVHYKPGDVKGDFLYGVSIFLKSGLIWKLIYTQSDYNVSTLYPQIRQYSYDTLLYDNLRIPNNDLSDNLLPVILDTFTDTDGTLLENHTPDIGGIWVSQLGSIDINSGVISPVSLVSNKAIYTQDSGESDVVIKFDATGLIAERVVSLIVRYVDAQNYWFVYLKNTTTSVMTIYEKAGDVLTERATVAITTPVGKVIIIADGQTITAWNNDTDKIEYASATSFETSTIQGVGCDGQTGYVLGDNFSVHKRSGYTDLDNY